MKRYIILPVLFLITASMTLNAQKKKKAYIKYNLTIEKADYEMVSMEKIKAKYNYQLEMAWNEDWALMRKQIRDQADVYFLQDPMDKEMNVNVYVHILATGEKYTFPIEDHFDSRLNTMVASMRDFSWSNAEQKTNIAGLSCSNYELKVAAFPHDTNQWCISTDNKAYFDFHPFFKDETLGLPLRMETGSSIKLIYEATEVSKNISEQLMTFDKKSYEPIQAQKFKNKFWQVYGSIFEVI